MADKEPWDDDLAREIETDLDLETQENITRGMSPDEARYAARRALGNRLLIQEEVARMHQPTLRVFADTLLQDLRHALRLFRRTPGFSLLATLTLALGIGAVTVIYSVIHGVLFAPFPYVHQDRMVDVLVQDTTRPAFRGPLSVPEFLDFRDQSHVFEAVAGTYPTSMLVAMKDGTENLDVIHVTPDAFDYLGVRPLIGRGIGQRDGQPDAPPVVVLSHKLWVSHFSLDPNVLGRTMVLDDVPRTIVGVMPPRFTWWVADVWIPAILDRAAKDANVPRYWFQARLKPGMTLEAAEAELTAIALQRARLFPNEYPKQFRIDVITIIDFVVGKYRGVLYTLLAAVGLLLLIACCNVANMLLARATTREREMAVRAALGAGRLRIVRQLFVESLLLAMAGAIGGVLLAYVGLEALAQVMPRQNVPYETELRIDGSVLLVTLVVSLGAALLFGLAPALHGARRELVAGMKAGGKGVAGAAFRHRALRNTLVVAEIALSLVLLLGAGLLMRSFITLMSVDLGIDTSNVLVVPLSFPDKPQDSFNRERFLQQVQSRVATLPSVVGADYTNTIPPYGGLMSDVDVPGTAQREPPKAMVQTVSGTFLKTFDVPIVHGRFWSTLEGQSARRLAVVNQAFADRYLAGQDPIGQTVVLSRLRAPNEPEPIFEIIGVAANVRNTGPRNPTAPEVFVPSSTTTRFGRVLVLRTAIPPLQVLNSVRREIWAVDRRVASTDADELDTMLLRFNYAQPRFSLIVLTVFASVGLVLVAIGVYGVLAYTISQQTQELAVRMALGASRTHVVHIVLRLGLRLIAGGIVAGVIASFATNRLIANQLWNTSPTDALTMVLAIATITMIGVLACGVPAWRALRIDPMQALRHE